jgi:hypothetical protein
MNNIFLKFFYAYCKILKFKNRKKIFLENYNMHKNINVINVNNKFYVINI